MTGSVPVEPLATRWRLPDPATAGEEPLVGVGADLEPGTLLAAYRSGLFPMPVRRRVMGWWSPPWRGVLPLDGIRTSRSLRRSARRFEIRVDTDFAAVIDACAAPRSGGAWINPAIREAYLRLHELGWAHSVETWDERENLVGGLYGVADGGLFAGESMFHRATDASKVALLGLVELLGAGEPDASVRLLDTQWRTDHLASLGCVEISRAEYLERLAKALTLPPPPAFA